MLIREYNLTINNNNQKLFIPVQTENNKKKDLKCFYLFQLIFRLTISSSHFQSKINKTYIQVKF